MEIAFILTVFFFTMKGLLSLTAVICIGKKVRRYAKKRKI